MNEILQSVVVVSRQRKIVYNGKIINIDATSGILVQLCFFGTDGKPIFTYVGFDFKTGKLSTIPNSFTSLSGPLEIPSDQMSQVHKLWNKIFI